MFVNSWHECRLVNSRLIGKVPIKSSGNQLGIRKFDGCIIEIGNNLLSYL